MYPALTQSRQALPTPEGWKAELLYTKVVNHSQSPKLLLSDGDPPGIQTHDLSIIGLMPYCYATQLLLIIHPLG